MSWLRVDDSFPEHKKIMGLKSVGAKWLHVVGLCQCAANLTDGHIEAHRLKVVCAIAEVPRPAFCIAQLVAAGLWIEDGEGGYTIKDYLDYNPDAATVKARRDQRKDAGKAGAAARWGDGESPSEAFSDSPSPGVMPPDPDPDPSPVKPYRPVGGNIQEGQLHSLEVRQAAESLFEAIRPEHCDAGTRQVVLAYAQELSVDDFKSVRRELVKRRERVRNDGKWVNGALQRRAIKAAALRSEAAA